MGKGIPLFSPPPNVFDSAPAPSWTAVAMRILPYRISRYVFVELMPPFMLGLGLYTFVLMMNHFFLVA